MPKRTLVPDGVFRPNGAYSHAVVSDRTIYVAGQLPIDPTSGEIVGEDIETQTRKVLENIQSVLASAGATLDDITKTTIFLLDIGDFPAVNRVYGEYFKTDPPARSTLGVSGLARPGARIEIEAIAERD